MRTRKLHLFFLQKTTELSYWLHKISFKVLLLSSHLLISLHPVQTSKFGECTVMGYCSFKVKCHEACKTSLLCYVFVFVKAFIVLTLHTSNSIPIIWNNLSQFVSEKQRIGYGQGVPTKNVEPLFSSLMLAGFHNHSCNYEQNDNQHVPPFPQSEFYTLVHCITITHHQCWWLCYKLTSKGHCPYYVK